MSQSATFYESLVGREEIWFATSTVAVHAQFRDQGFRQRDVKFFIELFSNWLECALLHSRLEVKNTQVSRYLDRLADEGYARKVQKTGKPRYRLTRIGLIELLQSLVAKHYLHSKESFFFLYYFLKNYRGRLEKLVADEGRFFPHALKVELEQILNVDTLVTRELSYAKKELIKLQKRIEHCVEISALVQERRKQKVPEAKIIAELEGEHPYALHSQKPLRELLEPFPKEMREWEMTVGYRLRAEEMLVPTCALLEAYVKSLEKLKNFN